MLTKKKVRTRLGVINSGGYALVSIIGIIQGLVFYLPAALISILITALITLGLIEVSIKLGSRSQTELRIPTSTRVFVTGFVFVFYLIGSGGVDLIPLRYHSPNPPNVPMILVAILVAGLTFAAMKRDWQNLRQLPSRAKRS
jgi:hypothetical protein